MRVAILGNSASGKTTLARSLAASHALRVLDLDTLAWATGLPPTRREFSESTRELAAFCDADGWVVEGCYGDLIRDSLRWRPELVLMTVPAAVCADRARARAWEPHKFATPEAQQEHLEMLVAWITDYDTRDGEMSRSGHRAIYDAYEGPKRIVAR